MTHKGGQALRASRESYPTAILDAGISARMVAAAQIVQIIDIVLDRLGYRVAAARQRALRRN
jgi:hypothetical protein